MRIAYLAAIFVLLGILLFQGTGLAASMPTKQEIIAKPNLYFSETLRDNITPYDFFKAASKINTFFGFESFFKKQAVHNPFVWRQGGKLSPRPIATGRPIPGPPFDIDTATGIIPGCLHRLCPPPQAAFWVDGICWCSN